MKRIVNKQGGFSFVEILVSMVILSIVVLIMSNILITTTKAQGTTISNDIADMIILEKLAELQSAAESAEPTGEEEYPKNNTIYTVNWVIDESSTPANAMVTASWTGANLTQESTNVTGYIATKSTCPPQTAGEIAPTNITFEDNDGNDVGSGIIKIMGTVFADDEIINLIGHDVNFTAGEDNLTFEIVSQDVTNMFRIDGDKLIANEDLTSAGSFDLTLTVFDCSGLSPASPIDFTVTVDNVAEAPVVTNVFTATIPENSSAGTFVKTISGSCNSDINWTVTNGPVQFRTSPTPTNASAQLEVSNGVALNYETALDHKVYATIEAENSLVPGLVTNPNPTIEITLTDVAELPNNINFTTTSNPLTIESNVSSKTDLATFTIDDPDQTAHNHTISVIIKKGSVNKSMSGFTFTNTPPYTISATTGLTKSSYPEGDYVFTVRVTDNYVTATPNYYEKTLTLKIVDPAGCTLNSWVNSTYFPPGAVIAYGGRHYKSNYGTTGNEPVVGGGQYDHWIDLGVCNE